MHRQPWQGNRFCHTGTGRFKFDNLQFFANASHELKPPLTVILTNTELLKTSGQQTDTHTRFTQNTQIMAQLNLGSLTEKIEQDIILKYAAPNTEVKRHGKIWTESQGDGNTFYVRLPLSANFPYI